MGLDERIAAAEDRAEAAEKRADAADVRTETAERETHSAQSLAERLDRLIHHLTAENQRMRNALNALTIAIEEILTAVEDEDIRARVQAAIHTARVSFQQDD